MRSRLSRRVPPRRAGTSAVDLALTLPLTLLAALTLLQLGLGQAERQKVVRATYDIASFAARGPTPPSAEEVRRRAPELLAGHALPPDDLVVEVSHTRDHGELVVVVKVELPVRVLGTRLRLPTRHVQRLAATVGSS